MATISGSRAGEAETRANCSRRWLSSIMSAWVRRALRQMATRSARPATAMARNAAAKSRLMLGTGEGRSGAGWVMRPLQIGERAVAGQERRRSAAMLAGGGGAVEARPRHLLPHPREAPRAAPADRYAVEREARRRGLATA